MKRVFKRSIWTLYLEVFLLLLLLCYGVSTKLDARHKEDAFPTHGVMKIGEYYSVSRTTCTDGLVFLMNGAMPFLQYYGYGHYDYSSDSFLHLTNRAGKDAVVLLINSGTGEVERNVYIRDAYNFTMADIPEGEYYIRVALGHTWDPHKYNGEGLPNGGFVEEATFLQSRIGDTLDYRFGENDNGIIYPVYSLVLYDADYIDHQFRPTTGGTFFQ